MTTQSAQWAAQASRLRADVGHLLAIREIDQGIQEMVAANPVIGQESEFWSVYHFMYATTISTGLRRVIFSSKSAVCLLRLLNSIEKSGSRPPQITVMQIASDSDQLRALGTLVKEHVDEYIAHIAPAPAERRVRWKDLSNALDLCAAVTLKYSNLLTTDRFGDLTPVLSQDWRVIFRTAWMPESVSNRGHR